MLFAGEKTGKVRWFVITPPLAVPSGNRPSSTMTWKSHEVAAEAASSVKVVLAAVGVPNRPAQGEVQWKLRVSPSASDAVTVNVVATPLFSGTGAASRAEITGKVSGMAVILALPVPVEAFTAMVSEATFLSTPLASVTVRFTEQGPSAAGAVKTTCEVPWTKSLPVVVTGVPRLPQVATQPQPMSAVWPASGSCALALIVTVSFCETDSEVAVIESITGALLASGTPGATWFMLMTMFAVWFLTMICPVTAPWYSSMLLASLAEAVKL